jgi:NAD(P)-dependent dehydrogenase (short-subunit alcohol dehydrogenase family)
MTTRWTATDLPSQRGRTFVITGANSGIGLQAARALAAAGGHVVLAVRDLGRGGPAAATIAGSTEVRELDLTDLSSVRRYAERWTGDIDVLINNAGIMAVPEGRTADGFELQLGTNHLGPFVLTNLLLPHVTDRVVVVSSLSHRHGHLDRPDLNWERRRYQRWGAYGQSKLANLLFMLELQRRLDAAGSTVRAIAVHPGWAATNLQTSGGGRIREGLGRVANRLVAQSDEMGALPTLYGATQDLPGGSYVGPDGRFEMGGHPTLVGRSRAALDLDDAAWLWAESERLTGVPAAV